MRYEGFAAALRRVAPLAFGAVILSSGSAMASTIVVTPTSMGDWAFDNRNVNGDVTATTTGSMVNGPDTPPLGTGSANLTLPANASDGSSELRNSGYAGTALQAITSLSYSTYMTDNNGQQFPYFGLVVSADGGQTVYDTIFFEPPYQTPSTGNPALPDQGATIMNMWQTWDALSGGWWDNNGLSDPGSGPQNSLSWNDLLIAMATDANVDLAALTIMNTDDGNGHDLGGVRFNVGFGSFGDTFNGYIDNFTIGVEGEDATTYDFEAMAAVPLPAGAPLLAAGLGVLGFLGWRKKRASGLTAA